MWQTVPKTSFSKLVMYPDRMYIILTTCIKVCEYYCFDQVVSFAGRQVVYCLKIYDIILVPAILEYALLLVN